MRVNPGSGAGARVDDRQAFTPAVHVGDEGTVTVTFYDFRSNTAADGKSSFAGWQCTAHWSVARKPVETDRAEGAEGPIAALLEERRGGTAPVMSSATSAPR